MVLCGANVRLLVSVNECMCTSDVTEYLFIIQSKAMDTVIIFPNILLCCEMFTLSKEVMYQNFLHVAMETVSMHIDTVVLYVYQYCRRIDTTVTVISKLLTLSH